MGNITMTTILKLKPTFSELLETKYSFLTLSNKISHIIL